MQITDFDYDLPDALIARYPLENRSSSRLLHIDKIGTANDRQFTELLDLLNTGDLLVLNDTKVMKARLFGQKESGGAVEVLVERILPDDDSQKNTALCHVRSSRSPKVGQMLHLAGGDIIATMQGRMDNLFILSFNQPILPALEQHGELPIPPYFERQADDTDDTRYQTVFFDPTKSASVAAPTASLHFDEALLNALKEKGVDIAFVTLHVGAGTFAPVKTDDITAHKMHTEYGELPAATAERINRARKNGGRIIAVGTTVTRVLETAFQKTTTKDTPDVSAWAGDTNIFIYPPYRFGVVDALITNFHLPKSTLLMLVSAFSGTSVIKNAYQHAIKNEYRFFSYGDAMFLEKPAAAVV
ncbi:MAG: tRNA preQ1(34) S-adenosylmethionine ribosyltransferase-isomerase QueA [Moraxella sp.]|nr:tRNA preQ1(34) S-adenosylmethionine ribosyltransferase-isomerase QueA [Moraxella sp.]